jgi:hypothetical protein
MKKYQLTWALCLTLLVSSGFVVSHPTTGVAQEPDQDAIALQQQALPIVEYDAPAVFPTPAIRQSRSAKYNDPDGGTLAEEWENDTGSRHTSSDIIVGLAALPVRSSDAIVVGRVTTAAAYLSADKKNVYSEYQVTVSRIFKNTSPIAIQIGGDIAAERPIGAVRLPKGDVVYHTWEYMGVPKVNTKYVLFLRAAPDGTDFILITGYEITNGVVTALDGNGQFGAKRYHGVSESILTSDLDVATK